MYVYPVFLEIYSPQSIYKEAIMTDYRFDGQIVNDDGTVIIPSGHVYGESGFHIACSTYSCGTCNGACCDWCEPITINRPKGDY